MRKTELFIEVVPVPKGRPRFSRGGHAYTPKKTELYEALIREKYGKREFYDCPIWVRLIFSMPIPKSYPKWKLAAINQGILKHEKTPDLDNLAKAVLDALNGVAYKDDSKITRLILSKHYSTVPGVTIEIQEDVY